ncbi:MAG: aspartate aminotransferase family protein [Candidatus Rokubacteria bacterium]|nr:aspartate aminotransferase family protein [Candidatus Rokubacteria bacterium]
MTWPSGGSQGGEGAAGGDPRRAWAVGPAARALIDEDARFFLRQSLSTPCLSAVRDAQGIWIEDVDGRRYMDFHGNNVHHLGHRHPRLVEALKAQLDSLPFVPRRYTAEPAVAAARRLAEVAPGPLGKVLFAPSGSDAVEIALRLARAATGRFKTVSFWGSFHGAGFGASSVGGQRLFRSGRDGPLLPGTEHVPPPDCYRCPYGYTQRSGRPDLALCGRACADMVRYVLDQEGDVAAVVAETVRTTAPQSPPGFWRAVREACDAHGALLILDEIPYGLGKTGKMFGCEHDGVVPDILVVGKALGGGVMPVAAIIARPELDVAATLAIGHYTHEKSPLAARAVLATLDIIERDGLVENARAVGAHALNRLQELADRHPLIGDIRGLGLVLAVDLVVNRETREPARDAAEAILYRALERGLSLRVSGDSVLSLTPPLIITEAEMDAALGILDACLADEERARGL